MKHRAGRLQAFIRKEKINIAIILIAGLFSGAALYCYHYRIGIVALEEKWDYILYGEEQKMATSSSPVATSSTLMHQTAPLILVYHKILTPEQYAKSTSKNFVTTTDLFADEMKYLKDHGYSVITMAQAIQMEQSHVLPEKPVVLTFDDGWKDQYEQALPILDTYGIKATFYIYTGVIGAPAFMDWKELASLVGDGMEIGDHTKHHPRLSLVPQEKLKGELLGSKITLEKHLNITVTDFAYPYGVYNEQIVDLLRQYGYASARTSDKGITSDYANPYLLKAFYAPKSMEGFVSILNKQVVK